MEIEPKFENSCRICTIEHEVGIMIFSEEGEKMMLRDNIVKFLHVEIAAEDRLPKMICISCCTRLDSFRIFAGLARQSQIKLSKRLEVIDKMREYKNFLRLSGKDCSIECVNKQLNGYKSPIQMSSDVTEMEVRLDPMMFLKCEIEDSQSSDSIDKSCNDVPYNDYSCKVENSELSNAESYSSLTIELVKKESTTCVKSEPEKNLKSLPDLKPIILTKKQNGSEVAKPYICPLCPRSFLSSIALQNHTWLHFKNKNSQETNGDDKTFCPVCFKELSPRTNLKFHMESHLPKDKHFCDICGRVFKTECNLIRHKECHGDENYSCKDCGRVYPSNSTLRAHSVTHSDARPHNCPLCKKTFKRNQDLKFHINQHTGARPYRCPYCPKAFASSGNCFSHRKRMHPLEIERDKDKAINYSNHSSST